MFFTLGEKQNSKALIATTLKRRRSKDVVFPSLDQTVNIKTIDSSEPTMIRLGRQAISQDSRAYSQLSQILNKIRIRNKVQNPEQTTEFMDRSNLSKWVRKTL